MEDLEGTVGSKYKRLKARNEGTPNGSEMHSIVYQNLLITSRGRSHRKEVRAQSQLKKSSGEIEENYQTIGKTLSNPEALSGLLRVANIFTRKGEKLPHIYKNSLFITLLLFLVVFITFMLGTIIVFWNQEKIEVVNNLVLVTAIVVGVCFQIFGFWRCFARFTGAKFLRRKLESMETFVDLCEISNGNRRQLLDENVLAACDCRLVGSAGDGFGFFALQGSNRHVLQKKSVLTQDIDMNIFLNSLEVKPENLWRINGAIGYTWIVLSEEQKAAIADPVILKSLMKVGATDNYVLSASAISRNASKYFTPLGRLHETSIIEHFPALTLQTKTLGPNGTQEYEVDYAFALRNPHWPREAAEWITRKRSGLDKKTVDRIVSNGCYLVHKPCGKDTQTGEHDHSYDWRFTFASAEADLFHYHRDKKALKMAFVILKFLIKFETETQGVCDMLFHNYTCLCEAIRQFIYGKKEIPVLRTYHLKTVFLWMAEEETHLDFYTIQGNKTLKEVFMCMLHRYRMAVKNKYLPNYFIRERNMFAGTRYLEEDFKKAETLLSYIRRKPTLAIQENFERQFINMQFMTGFFIGFLALYILGYAAWTYLRTAELLMQLRPNEYGPNYSL